VTRQPLSRSTRTVLALVSVFVVAAFWACPSVQQRQAIAKPGADNEGEEPDAVAPMPVNDNPPIPSDGPAEPADGQPAPDSRVLPDTREKQQVLAPIIEDHERLRRSLADGDRAAIGDLLDRIREGDASSIAHEEPLLQAAADCLDGPGPDAVAAARRVLDDHPASSVRKQVRRICGID
jgi:hypothetical protein